MGSGELRLTTTAATETNRWRRATARRLIQRTGTATAGCLKVNKSGSTTRPPAARSGDAAQFSRCGSSGPSAGGLAKVSERVTMQNARASVQGDVGQERVLRHERRRATRDVGPVQRAEVGQVALPSTRCSPEFQDVSSGFASFTSGKIQIENTKNAPKKMVR